MMNFPEIEKQGRRHEQIAPATRMRFD